ncbi:MAG TPA: Gfo/Idh/MocA family oxidoreductase, partial [Lacipirellulaceae bacterium]|nr:Gfo/Idh/MocA family oxidoreductase [Lacipirellulaceae bacterium]
MAPSSVAAVAACSRTACAAGGGGRRIGLLDYDLDNYHADTFLKLLRGPLHSRGFEVTAATAIKAEPSRRWARERQLRYVDRFDQLAEAADCFMVLAPDNTEVHLELAEAAFPFGRPTFVDKTFAPDYASAKKLFELAARHKTPVQSTSALRYTNVQEVLARDNDEPVVHMTAWGGGMNFQDRAVHPLE